MGPHRNARRASQHEALETRLRRAAARAAGEGLKNLLIGHHPSGDVRHQLEREGVRFRSVHGVARIRRHDDAIVAVGRLEARAQDARRRVDAGENDGIRAEAARQQELEVGVQERAVSLLGVDDEVGRLEELGNDLGARHAGDVVAPVAAALLGRVVGDRVPKWIGERLGRIAIRGDDVHDRHAEVAQPHEQVPRAGDNAGATLGRKRQRGDRGVEMPAMHVDGDERGAARIERHGAFLPTTLLDKIAAS